MRNDTKEAAQRESFARLQDAGRRIVDLETKEYPVATDIVRRDGSTPLTAEWDIGEDMAIRAERIEARDAEGLSLQDELGNTLLLFANGELLISTSTTAGKDINIRAADTIFFSNQDGTVTYVKADSTALHVLAKLRALSAAGLRIEDDGGNAAIIIAAGGIPTFWPTTLQNSGVVNENYRKDVLTIADIAASQVLTIDVLHAAAGRAFITNFDISLAHSSSTTAHAALKGFVIWFGSTGTVVIQASDITFVGLLASATITGITGGFRITATRTATVGTMSQNMAHFEHTGYASQNTSYLVTIT